ncbi:hypothetical protein DP939_02255 [Spongiactinospora rosea]|uniref:Uncharacterized protein n=1 Tax=Spongiactinospora rosea TaxID=2248750 RepID=A0A366M6V4_9ACTN|nr:hypothetical protein [Spongiactinospora rosea]RBQ21553.1 hypothetical protein DP939_02255 [Spongiactinospora rosea]
MLRYLFAAVGVFLAVYVGLLLLGVATLPFRTAAGVAERVGDPDAVLYNYEHFFDLCADVRTADRQIADKEVEIAAYERRKPDGEPGDRFQAAPKGERLATELAGLREHRADLAETYNADSAKASRNVFKPGTLPKRIGDTTPTCN